MRIKQIITKTSKGSKEYDAVNATLLQKGGFIEQAMAGVWIYLPLGLRVLNKIENIVREEMDKIGTEMLMPAMAPRALWETTGRAGIDILFEARGANEASRRKNNGSYILNSTHEEVVTPAMMKHRTSYKDLPFAVYQIQSKFRNEARPKSGLLRGREFRMKDLYSFHASEKDRQEYYERAIDVYRTIFHRLGLGEDTVVARASGGEFTNEFSLEFDTKCETGEDTVYYDEVEDVYYNAEVAPEEVKSQGNKFIASEVGNIFPLGTKYADAFGYTYTDETGKSRSVHMASYGIGTSRLMGILVEKFHDERGIIWPENVAPYKAFLTSLGKNDDGSAGKAENLYGRLVSAGVEVLLDDRGDVSAGQKMSDADLMGLPWRLVISPKTGNKVEIKRRGEDNMKLMEGDEIIKKLI